MSDPPLFFNVGMMDVLQLVLFVTKKYLALTDFLSCPTKKDEIAVVFIIGICILQETEYEK